MAATPTTCELGLNLKISDVRLDAPTRDSWRAKARQKVSRNVHFTFGLTLSRVYDMKAFEFQSFPPKVIPRITSILPF